MRLPAPFVKLPLRFDVDRLQGELAQFDESEWRAHPQDYAGNSALILISHNGSDNDDLAGAMAPTPRLSRCAYIRQVLGTFNTVLGRSRLMRLAPGAEVETHSDIAYYWRDHVRIHIPIVTDPNVRFVCEDVEVNMAAGEAWIFDNWRPHYVLNHTGITRVHLVIDTVGSAAFWRLVSQGQILPAASPNAAPAPKIQIVAPDVEPADLRFETHNSHQIASPDTVKSIVQDVIGDLHQQRNAPREQQMLESHLVDLAHEWRAVWALYGTSERAYPLYGNLIAGVLQFSARYCASLRLPSNGSLVHGVLKNYLGGCFNPHADILARLTVPRFDRPIIIVAAPRSGSTLLFETLISHPEVWSLGNESHGEIENIPGLSPRDRNFDSNVLTAEDANPDICNTLKRVFAERLRSSEGAAYAFLPENRRPDAVRIIEKTPKNSLRIPFLNAVFPDALFIFLHRQPEANLGSMIDAWRSGEFVTYRDLPDWQGLPWSLLLTPGWRTLPAGDLATIAADQWRHANAAIARDLSNLPQDRWRSLRYEDLVHSPAQTVERIWQFCGLRRDEALLTRLASGLPLSRYTLSPPTAEKWRRHAAEITRVMPSLVTTVRGISSLGNTL